MINVSRTFQILEEVDESKLPELAEELEYSDIDGIPHTLSFDSRDTFVDLYCTHHLLVQRQAFLDQMLVGLNHYGVSLC